MAKELPYFRFTAQEWQNGDISLESYALKGLFIDVCAYYWVQDCVVTRKMLFKKFRNARRNLMELFEIGIIKQNANSDEVVILYLNKQYDLLSTTRKAKQMAGSKGGQKKASNATAELKQNPTYKDKDKEKDNNKEKDKQTKEVFNFRKSLINYGFDEKLIKDWLDVRKLKKAKNTETAYNGFIREIDKLDEDKNELLRICVEKSWSGFNAEWIKNIGNGQNQQSSTKTQGKDRISTDFSELC